MIIHPHLNPIIFEIGPLSVNWYSLSYVSGILIGWYLSLKLITKHNLTITKQNIDDYISWVILGIIIGGRLGYVLFYDPVKYFNEPGEILKTYLGGMSFHGGVIGFALSSYIFCRRNNINFLNLTDLVSVIAAIGIFLGRIANFINAELYGRVTNVPWGVVFPYSDGYPRHPSQIYEALLEGLSILIIQIIAANKYGSLKYKGFNTGLFLALYGIFRFIIEFWREPDQQIGYIAGYFSMGQLLCAPMVLLGLYIITKSLKLNGD